MGAAETKLSTNGRSGGEVNCDIKPCSPTPSQKIRQLCSDPRSPSADIARTPTEVLKTPVQSSLTPLNKTKDVINTVDDPRSPTTEFTRTPIVVTDIITEKQPQTIHNKLLDNARLPELAPTPLKPRYISRLSKISEAHTLSEATATPKIPENKRNSFVGLLETNIDFIETDLDTVIQNKSLKRDAVNVGLDKSIINEVDEVVTDNKDAKTEETNLENKSTETDHFSSVETLNRKLTNLIYEDKFQVDATPTNPRVAKLRTPLHDQNPNTNSPLCKSVPVLRVSDKPTKAPNSGSRIPVFKDRKMKGKVNVQCENTPPRIKAKSAQWAAEDSMVI